MRTPNEVGIFVYRGDRFLVLHRVHERKVVSIASEHLRQLESYTARRTGNEGGGHGIPFLIEVE